MPRWLNNILHLLLACTLSFLPPVRAQAAQTATLLQVTVGEDGRLTQRLVVYHSNPQVLGRPLAIAQKNIATSYSVKVDITHEEMHVINKVLSVMRRTSVTPGCGGADVRVAAFTVAWAIIYYDIDDKELGSIYLRNDGECAIVRDRLYRMSPALVTLLRSEFAFD